MKDVYCWNCGNVAFAYSGNIGAGEVLRSKDAWLEDGSHPDPEATISCQHCQSGLLWLNTADTEQPLDGEVAE